MRKMWKIIGAVVAGLVLLLVLVAGGIFFAVNQMKHMAEEIYGGPLRDGIVPVVSWAGHDNKMAVFMDTYSELVMVILLAPLPPGKMNPPFSEKAVKSVLAHYRKELAVQTALEGVDSGKVTSTKLGEQTIYTLQYPSSTGKMSELGVLNLDKNQLLFVASGDFTSVNSLAITSFLMNMPRLKQDSHLMPAIKCTSKDQCP